MQLILKLLDGQKKTVQVESGDTILAMKQRFGEKMGIPPAQLKLIFKGAPLLDDQTIEQSKLADQDMIHLILHLHGG
jgi:hypothetical protein